MSDPIPETRRWFADAIDRHDDDIDLALAALLIAKEEYADLAIDACIARLDDLADTVAAQVNRGGSPRVVCEGLCDYLGRQRGFRGDEDHYYDARNSYLNQVLDHAARGSAAALSVLYLEVGRRLGLDLRPVAFPFRCLLRLQSHAGKDAFLDPYNGGRLLDLEGCRRLLTDSYGSARSFSAALVAPGTKRQLIGRLLQDLRRAYLRDNDFPRALRTLDLLIALSPWDLELIRDRGLLHARTGNAAAAAADLAAFVAHAPPGAALEGVKEVLRKVSRAPGVPFS